MKTVINISGKAKHGKDTFARILSHILEDNGYTTQIVRFADRLKEEARRDYGWDGEKDEKGRTLLQWLGTYKRETVDIDYWVKLAEEQFRDVDFILIPDTRYENEITYFRNNGKYLNVTIRVERYENGKPYDNGLTPTQKMHPSETALDNYIFDFVVRAESGVENLEKAAQVIAKLLMYEV